MNRRLFAVLGLVSALCLGPTALRADDDDGKKAAGLTIPVSGFVTPTGGTRTAATGNFTIRKFERAGDHINAAGTLVLNYATAQGLRTVTSSVSVPLESITTGSNPVTRASSVEMSAVNAQAPACDILTLRIGAIHLDLLGLVVDLAPVALDITAQPGAGNLLGNLLCAVANLLNPGGILTQLQAVLNILNQILAILG